MNKELNECLNRLSDWCDKRIAPAWYVLATYVLSLALGLILFEKAMSSEYIAGLTVAQFTVKLTFPVILFCSGHTVLQLVLFVLEEHSSNIKKKKSEVAPQLLLHQIEKCNIANSSVDTTKFELCVNTLFQMLPTNIRQGVENQVDGYKTHTDIINYTKLFEIIMKEFENKNITGTTPKIGEKNWYEKIQDSFLKELSKIRGDK